MGEASSKSKRREIEKLAVCLVFFVSGLCGLGCQFAWTRAFGIGLGHEMPAVLSVVAAFFGGVALGAWSLDGVISRSPRPGRWYAVLELVIGIWGLLLAGLLPVANDLASHLIGLAPSAFRHWAAAFSIPFLVLLPATFSMGATLPAMDRFVSPLMAGGRAIGALYAVNTIGAVAGTLAGTFLIVPATGLSGALVLFAGLNMLCGIAILSFESRIPKPSPQVKQAADSTSNSHFDVARASSPASSRGVPPRGASNGETPSELAAETAAPQRQNENCWPIQAHPCPLG